MAAEDVPLTAEDCAIGEVIADKYLIEGVIGRGSMGVVVRATHLGFDELVALKFIRPEMRDIDGIVSRFAREAKASVRIRNEHAVNVLDVGVADPIGPFFVMEYLEGLNLEELVDSQGAFDSPTAVKYVLEACEALAAAHAQGIIHRDIKPQNMFLAWQGRLELIKLLDFGISKAALSGQMFGDDLSNNERDWVMGTPLYMSPEQLRHAPDVDERTDIWSLGAVLYELLCGEPLFSGDTQTRVCRQVLEVGSRPVRLPIAGVPEALWDVIERCLSLDKEQRYASVAALGEALLPFAPNGSSLHVERARALLGLRPMDFLGDDEDIEDIDVDPIEEPETLARAPVPAPSSAERERRPQWVELAIPALACAVVALAVVQLRMSFTNQSSGDALQTAAFALRSQRECLAPSTPAPAASLPPAPVAAPSPPAALAPAPLPAPAALPTPSAATPAPAAVAPSAVAPSAAAAPAAPLTPSAPPAASAPVNGGGERAGAATTPATSPNPPAPLPSPVAPVAPSAALAAAPGAGSGASAPASAAADEAAQPSARAQAKQEAKPEPKLEFRLIDENPFDHARPAAGSVAPPLPGAR